MNKSNDQEKVPSEHKFQTKSQDGEQRKHINEKKYLIPNPITKDLGIIA